MKALRAMAVALLWPVLAAAEDPAPASFAWRATLDTTARAGLVRVELPGDALARLQSPAAADLRVFDGAGQPVPFALASPPRPADAPRQQTRAFTALPLHAAQPGARPPKGAVQLRLDENGERRSLWVQLGAAGARTPPPGPQPLRAALFDTRALQESVTALVVRARLPANVPVRLSLATSPDLENWTEVPVRGRVFRFEGEGAPANDRLELQAPLKLAERFLRLAWDGQEGVAVDAIVGLLPAQAAERPAPGIALGTPEAEGPAALEWQLPFATPIARIALSTPRENTVVPVRVLGRNQPSEPWRLLGSTVVYRLGNPGQESSNAPAALPRTSVRWLRVEGTHGARLQGVPLVVRALFDPVEVVFPAGAAGPYQLVAGRASTTSAALPVSMLAATTSSRLDALPLVQVASVQAAPLPQASAWQRLLPRGVDTRTASLWAVLAVGVLLLGGVAWTLLRQVNAKDGGTGSGPRGAPPR